jgi:hypothetical protein
MLSKNALPFGVAIIWGSVFRLFLAWHRRLVKHSSRGHIMNKAFVVIGLGLVLSSGALAQQKTAKEQIVGVGLSCLLRAKWTMAIKVSLSILPQKA